MTEIRRVSRGRLLTAEEAKRYRTIREQVAKEMPQIIRKQRESEANDNLSKRRDPRSAVSSPRLDGM